MKRKSLILVAVLAIALVTLCFSEQNNSVTGNWYPVPSLYVWVTFNSSQGNYAAISFFVEAHVSMDTAIVAIKYNLDDTPNITNTELWSHNWMPGGGEVPNNHIQYSTPRVITIERVSFGNHTLKVYLVDAEGRGLSRDMDFLLTANSTKVYSSSGPSIDPSDYNSTPTPTPAIPEFPPELALVLLFTVIPVSALAFRRKKYRVAPR